MKVKVADLKANLSRHLLHVSQTGETLEVCVRENPVAYLAPVGGGRASAAEIKTADALRERLHAAGLVLAEPASTRKAPPPIHASVAEDGRTDVATVAVLRTAKDW